MHTILPKERPILHTPDLRALPLFFLAGPIQGAGDWHVRMAELLEQAVGDCIIVNPSRYTDPMHPHYQHKLHGPVLDSRQTFWERYYLEQAANGWHTGCVIFWLANQVEQRPDGSPYGRDTAGELGEWRGRMMHDSTLRVQIGAESGYHGLSVLAANFEAALGSDFAIHDSMEALVETVAYRLHNSQLSFIDRLINEIVPS